MSKMNNSTILIGTDEAGYGSVMGPLIISTIGFRLPEPIKDKSLYSLTGLSKNSTSDFPVCDSKELFGQSKKKYQKAKRVILSFLKLATPEVDLPFTALKFFKEVVVSFHEDNFSFPCGHNTCFSTDFPIINSLSELNEINSLSEEIGFQLKKHKIQFLKPVISAICVKNFNKLCEKYKKSDIVIEEGLLNLKQLALTEQFAAQVGMISSARSCEFYIKRLFEGVNLKKLGKKDFTFLFNNNSIQYLIDAEHKSFCVALASMFGKYTRELMWKSTIKSLFSEIQMKRYISGYRDEITADFIKEIKSSGFSKVPEECLIRNK